MQTKGPTRGCSNSPSDCDSTHTGLLRAISRAVGSIHMSCDRWKVSTPGRVPSGG
jgi:hypothetical protein